MKSCGSALRRRCVAENFWFCRDANPDDDTPEQAEFRRTSRLIDEGMCPNGCGPMTQGQSPSNWQCPECRFTYFKSSLGVGQ